ncbi:MYND domain protein (SamB), putative [Cordyceps militaris CM01]|uniref:MYND-type zinc finger protein samB n=2 Tax=Cordyceps militaris TaxID=73501 RepID=G3JD82_CORMM|nr:MYND domain protein (SamB), putative [Cordyceps militaris CM01]ATY66731.1 MYND domain [Cordyceps militaris]EGX92557.1 MYND domain protein (SamB), putative [Cordyceps militaris CM01]
MREVNFSIPNVNKASVGITTALYDRRALDCTSTLPLINSLNHLAYLTTSSARIRDILTVDGGIERLVCILKQGRSKDMMGMWKWNLAFQCVVNIGVRGTENVRTRVVEADMVPVIATILDNYIKVIDRCREKADEAKQKQIHEHHHRHRSHDHRVSSRSSGLFANRSSRNETEQRTIRRQGLPPSIDVTASYAGPSTAAHRQGAVSSSASSPARSGTSDRLAVTPTRPRHNFRATEGQTAASRQAVQSLAPAVPLMEAIDGLLRPVRDADRLASMALLGQSELVSQPTSPTTPLPPPQLRSPTVIPTATIDDTTPQRRRPSIRHQNSTAEADDINNDSMPSDESPDAEMTGTGDMRSAVGIQDITMDDGEGMLATESLELAGAAVSEAQDTGAFNITHRSPIDGSIGSDVAPATVPPIGLSPNRPSMVSPPQPNASTSSVPRYLLDRHFVPNPQMLAVMPREEDVLMSLQLLAYVSKYCGLRSYFQNSHLVPRLAIGKDLAALDGEGDSEEIDDCVAVDEEYLLPNDFNLFPLVEKFTVRYHSTDMQYWAGVVMRNLCRKDDTRGGIRQCAYYQCGTWEEFPRQFAKCRRCRRTKYCSKECQKSAWAFHRHWCVAASQ